MSVYIKCMYQEQGVHTINHISTIRRLWRPTKCWYLTADKQNTLSVHSCIQSSSHLSHTHSLHVTCVIFSYKYKYVHKCLKSSQHWYKIQNSIAFYCIIRTQFDNLNCVVLHCMCVCVCCIWFLQNMQILSGLHWTDKKNYSA